MFYEDTIAAIATASVNGGVSIIRISGENAVKVADSCLKLKNKTLAEVKSHTIHYGYVVDEEGKTARRRPVRIGRQNPQYYEVVEGLQPGEKVIISGYDLFGENERLILR